MSEKIQVLVAIDYSDDIVQRLRDISPQLKVERHFPKVPDRVWQKTEVMVTSSTFPTRQQAPNLKWVQLNSAVMEHATRMPLIANHDIMVTSTSGIHATPMAEYTLGMMLAWEYQLPAMFKDQQQRLWRENRDDIYAPRHLNGQTVGIVGYGSIGREVARLANQFGMNVLAIKRDVMHPADSGGYREPGTGDAGGEIPERLYPPEALATMVRDCDYVVVLAPLVDDTVKMVNADVLEAMRDTAVLINIARGHVVDEAAMIDALSGKKIAGAILDVFNEEPLPKNSPLWQMDNVILSPHIAGNSAQYHEKAAAVFAENLQRYLERRELLNLLDRNKGY
ncbi:MAG: D-2-hydroxyacid dehydrogenase [Chloroflexota bacterium]